MTYWPRRSVYIDGDSASADAFGRLRISEAVTIFDSQFQYDKQPLLWQEIITGSVVITHLPNYSSVQIEINTGTINTYGTMQTYDYFRYQPFKSQAIAMTFVMGTGTDNIIRRVGYFDDDDGLYFEQNGIIDIAFVRRTSTSGIPVNNRYIQAEWNLDRLDGSGIINPSKITLDLSKTQIFVCDFQWLGVGRVRYGFVINGKLIYCHEVLNANNLTVPYIKTANLPLRYSLSTSGGTAYAKLICICSSVISEAGFEEDRAYEFSSKNTSNISVTTSPTALIAIRPKSTFNSIRNRIKNIINDIFVLAGNSAVMVDVIYDADITGGSWNSVDTNSGMEYNITVASYTNGIPMFSFPVASGGGSGRNVFGSKLYSKYPLSLNAFGADPKSILISATSTSVTSDCRAIINWDEIR